MPCFLTVWNEGEKVAIKTYVLLDRLVRALLRKELPVREEVASGELAYLGGLSSRVEDGVGGDISHGKECKREEAIVVIICEA